MKKVFRFFFSALLVFCAIFLGCSVLDYGEGVSCSVADFGTAAIRGALSFDGAFPSRMEASARTALPSFGNGIVYSVKASGYGREYDASVDSENLSFTLENLAVGEGGTEYTIFAEGTLAGEKVVSGSMTVFLEPGDSLFEDIPVEPEMSGGCGSISLEIDVSDDTEIQSCVVEYGEGHPAEKISASDGKISWTVSSISSGTYNAVFYFYSTPDADDENGILLYEFRESVQVFDGLSTNAWFGSSPYIQDGGTCRIRQELVRRFALSRIFVSADSDSATENGTRVHPYKSFSKALGALRDSSADFTIMVSGTLTGAQEIPDSVTKEAHANSITICGTDGGATIDGNLDGSALKISTGVPVTIRNITITGGKTTGNGGGINIADENCDVTLGDGTEENEVRLTGNIADDGGGIYNNGKLTVKRCEISGNTAVKHGGGIYNAGTLKFTGGTIESNTVTESSNAGMGGGGLANIGGSAMTYLEGGKIIGNTVEREGGAILNNSGQIFVYGNTMIGDEGSGKNTSKTGGGGISNYGYLYLGYKDANSDSAKTPKTAEEWTGKIMNNSVTSEGDGGGIRNFSNWYIYMAGGTIEANTADGDGGGVWASGTFVMTGGKICSNSVSEGKFGGGVFVMGTFKMGGTAYIPFGADKKNDVYLNSNIYTERKIEIVERFNLPSAAYGRAATISPSSYSSGTQVLSGDLVSVEYSKFSTASSDYSILMDGKIALVLTGAASGTSIYNALRSQNSLEINLGTSEGISKNTFSPPDNDSAYTNSGGFTGGGKDVGLIVGAGKTLTLSADYAASISLGVYCGRGISVSGTLVINENVILTSGNGTHWGAIEILDGGKVILNGGSIEGFNYGGTSFGTVKVASGGTFEMRSGSIINNSTAGGVSVSNGGTFIMSGGTISNNKNRFSDNGGGVTVANGGTFIKTGGSVCGNLNINENADSSATEMYIAAGGKYGTSESTLKTYTEITAFSEEF